MSYIRKKVPTEVFKHMWEGTSKGEYRFKLANNVALKDKVFQSMSEMRNGYIKRVKLTVSKYLVTTRFGLNSYSRQERLDALVDLVENGINRCGGKDIVTKPIFMAFSTDLEMQKHKMKGAQVDLLSQQIKDKEFMKLKGKRIEDVLWSSDIAMLILVIRNYMVRFALCIINSLTKFVNS